MRSHHPFIRVATKANVTVIRMGSSDLATNATGVMILLSSITVPPNLEIQDTQFGEPSHWIWVQAGEDHEMSQSEIDTRSLGENNVETTLIKPS
jgi:hypothetical protein